jgi:hypothetical protein
MKGGRQRLDDSSAGARLVVLLFALMLPGDAAAFPHIVRAGESVAQIAETIYGRVELERVIVAANALDTRRGHRIVPGMRLELPAVGHHTTIPGETWHSMAAEHLGSSDRGDVLARANDSQPWLRPEAGSEVIIPYNLRYIASPGDTTESVAYRFLGRRDEAWIIARYNQLKDAELRPGEIILLPLIDLELTEAGKKAAGAADTLVRSEAGGGVRHAQQRAAAELPQLAQEIRRGRYVEAVARGASLLTLAEAASGGEASLSQPQIAEIHRLLTIAYAALDATGLAQRSCAKWQHHAPNVTLSPIDHSPKILAVCLESGGDGDLDGVAEPAPSDAGGP